MVNLAFNKILFWLDDDETLIDFVYIIKGALKGGPKTEAKWQTDVAWSQRYLDSLKLKTSFLMYEHVTTTGKQYYEVLNKLKAKYENLRAALIDGCSYNQQTSEFWYLTQHNFTGEWLLDIKPTEEHEEDPHNWVIKIYTMTASNWNPVATALRDAIANQVTLCANLREGPDPIVHDDSEIVI